MPKTVNIIISFLVFATTTQAWWDTDWQLRQKFLFNNSSLAQPTDTISILITFHSGNVNYNDIKANGEDIRFVDENDSTALDYEIEEWNSSGTSYVWVQVPDIKATGFADSIFFLL